MDKKEKGFGFGGRVVSPTESRETAVIKVTLKKGFSQGGVVRKAGERIEVKARQVLWLTNQGVI